jgi:A/G-specific adenine glycosylase
VNQAEFKELVWEKGRELYRSMPWRENTDPYWVLVSELMLQQTQVDRVIPKFHEFMAAFSTVKDLAQAPLGDVLKVWSGLGYNRRAKFLHDAAKKIETDFKGKIPSAFEELVKLPGVGPNTAGAILAYSFNQPVVFIETNIRTVYFYHFFPDTALVSDKELKEVVAATIDSEHPRQWYWALMDYGAFLKKQGAGRIDKSSHYKKQAPLKGSLREMRGLILKILAAGDQKPEELQALLPQDERYEKALAALIAENMVQVSSDRLHLSR